MLIAQITDTHIVDKGSHWLNEPSTQTSERLIKAVSYLNQLNPLPDIVILTGDASDTGTKDSYEHLKELVQPLKSPLYLIPGNHDCRQTLKEAFSHHAYMPKKGFIQYAIHDYPISLIALDTHVPEKAFGEICEERFDWLKKEMEANEKPKLIFMHHPIAKTGNKLFDSITCCVPKQFEEFIASQNTLLGFITGHYHHFCLASYGNKPCFIAPSISPVHYFANPEDEHPAALELREPAITLHQWHHGNFFTSRIVYLKEEYQRIEWTTIDKSSLKPRN